MNVADPKIEHITNVLCFPMHTQQEYGPDHMMGGVKVKDAYESFLVVAGMDQKRFESMLDLTGAFTDEE